MQHNNEVSMQKLMRVHVLFALVTCVAAGGAGGCVGSGANSGGMDGGGFTGGTGGFIGGSGGVGGVGGTGGCFQCSFNCFDCGRGCFECNTLPDGSAGSDSDGGTVIVRRPWTAPFSDVGDNGTWRSTTDDSLCMGGTSLDSLGVWSDERGVYVMGGGQFTENVFLSGSSGSSGAAPPPFDAGFGGSGGFGGTDCFMGAFSCSGRVIYFNDGVSGWQKQHAVSQPQDGVPLRFSGIPLRELVLSRSTMSFGSECTLLMIDGSTERCEHSGSAVEGFFAVDSQLAYASIGTNLLLYDGAAWSVHPTAIPFTPIALWATATDVVAVGDLGRIARLRAGVWTSENHGIQQLTAVWGGEGSELWVGTAAAEIMHRDVTGVWVKSQSMAGVTCSRNDPITGIWGNAGTVYFTTERAIARWDGTNFRGLSNWTCALSDPNFGENPFRIRGVWGNSPTELFVSVSDASRSADPFSDTCGNGFVMYFDGTNFHRL